MWNDQNEWYYIGTWALLALIYLTNMKSRELWEMLWFSNDFPEEEFYGGYTIWMRSGQPGECGTMHEEWSQIRCKSGVLPDKQSIMQNGTGGNRKPTYIPFNTNHVEKTNAQWSLWTFWEESSPTIPLYMPNPRIGSQKTMVKGKGKAKTPEGKTYSVPKDFAEKVYAEWRKF